MFGLRRQETEPGASRAEADGRKKQKKMCCFHWLAEEEFVRVVLENGDGNLEEKKGTFLSKTIKSYRAMGN